MAVLGRAGGTMARTTVNVDDVLLAKVQALLGTAGITDTVNAAMLDVVCRAELASFELSEFDITDEDLADSRRDRTVTAEPQRRSASLA